MNPLLKVDFYKPHHFKMYPEGMTKLYSNLTARKSRLQGVEAVVVFGIQHFVKEYLIKDFNENFFGYTEWYNGKFQRSNVNYKTWILKQYQEETGLDDVSHVEALYDLGYLPIELKALDEGTLCPIGVPMLTVTNTIEGYGWLVNYIETLLSCMLWQPTTSATIANEYRKLLEEHAIKTTGSIEGVQWQAHDFSMRGMSSVESAIISGMAHLTSFTGTDTIPAIVQHRKSYGATGLIGASVPATEHSVMCMGEKESEVKTFLRLLELYPSGILSVVSDTWDLWKVLTEYLPEIKDEVLARDGKLVIRPDSGDPVDIICGSVRWKNVEDFNQYSGSANNQEKGVIELLWDVFGGTVNDLGYKVLDSHIGAIYGDSITLERAKEICERLEAKGFASTNIVFGVGSFTYQYNTRDTFGFAMKATYGEVEETGFEYAVKVLGDKFPDGTMAVEILEDPKPYKQIVGREIFKDPITDDGTKKSKKGLLRVRPFPYLDEFKTVVEDQQTWEQEATGMLTTVFKNSKLVKETTLDEIRERIKKG
jgi:nicotinamide phosphoribosyltransferase